MSDVEMVALTAEERGMLTGLVRAAIRKTDRGHRTLRQRYAAEYDDTRVMSRLKLLHGIYVKLGKDPANIRTGAEGLK